MSETSEAAWFRSAATPCAASPPRRNCSPSIPPHNPRVLSGALGCVLDYLVLGPAHAPAELDLAGLAGLGFERPFHHATSVAQIARGRRRGHGQHLDLDVLGLAHRKQILDRNADRELVGVADDCLEFALIGPGGTDQAG